MKTDWKDAIFARRKIRLENNDDGTVTPVDETEYTQEGDAFGANELNEIGEEINEIKKSVSDGKILVAAAITAKRVAAAATDSFATLANKINQIVLGSGNAVKADVLKGKTFTNNDGIEYTGTMEDKSGTTQSASASLDSGNSRVQLTIPATGKYSTASKLYATYTTILDLIGLTAAKIAIGNTILGRAGTYKGLGNAGAGDVLAGKTFSTANLSNSTGTLADKSGTTQSASGSLDSGNKRVQLTVPAAGKYSTTSKLYIAYATLANLIGLTAAKLWPGNTVLGIASNKVAMGGQTITPSKSQQTVSCNGKAMTGDVVVNAIPNIKGAITSCVSAVWATGGDGNGLFTRLSRGYYDNNAQSGYPEILVEQTTLRNALGITEDVIVKGNTIAGLAGSTRAFRQFTGHVTPTAAYKSFQDIEGTTRRSYYLDLDLGFYPMAIQAVKNDGNGVNYYFATGDQYNLCIVDMNNRKPIWFNYEEANICWNSTHIYLPTIIRSTAEWDVNIVGVALN